jgi:hypothetical protein
MKQKIIGILVCFIVLSFLLSVPVSGLWFCSVEILVLNFEWKIMLFLMACCYSCLQTDEKFWSHLWSTWHVAAICNRHSHEQYLSNCLQCSAVWHNITAYFPSVRANVGGDSAAIKFNGVVRKQRMSAIPPFPGSHTKDHQPTNTVFTPCTALLKFRVVSLPSQNLNARCEQLVQLPPPRYSYHHNHHLALWVS